MLQDILQYFSQKDEYGGANTPPEIRLLLLSLALSIKAKNILELGFDQCQTTKALVMSGARVVAVDLNPSKKQEGINAEFIISGAMKYLINNSTERFDLVFVDDDHEPSHVAEEVKLLRNMVNPGGFIAFHDVRYIPGLKDAILAQLPDRKYIEVSAFSPYYAMIGIDCGLLIVQF